MLRAEAGVGPERHDCGNVHHASLDQRQGGEMAANLCVIGCLEHHAAAAQVEGLRQRTLDLGLIYSPPPADYPEIASMLVRREPLVLAIPDGDALIAVADIRPHHLDGATWITVVRQPVDTNRGQFLAACIEAGFVPDIAYETADPLTSLGLVSAGLGLATEESLRSAAPPGIVFRDLPCFKRSVAIHLAWRRQDRRAVIAGLRQAAQEGQKAEGSRQWAVGSGQWGKTLQAIHILPYYPTALLPYSLSITDCTPSVGASTEDPATMMAATIASGSSTTSGLTRCAVWMKPSAAM
jgi:hypothetical protein